MESKSKRIGIHTCFQASTETPNLDDVALPNYQIRGWTFLSNQPGKSPGTCRCSSSCFFLTRSHIHIFEIVTMAPHLGTCSLFNRPPSFLLHLLPQLVLSKQSLKWDRVRLFRKVKSNLKYSIGWFPLSHSLGDRWRRYLAGISLKISGLPLDLI